MPDPSSLLYLTPRAFAAMELQARISSGSDGLPRLLTDLPEPSGAAFLAPVAVREVEAWDYLPPSLARYHPTPWHYLAADED